MMKKFKSSFSKGMLVSTAVVSLVFIVAIVVGIRKMSAFQAGSAWSVAYLVAVVLIAASIVVAYLLQIDHLVLTDDELVVKRKAGSVAIPRKSIVEAKRKSNITGDIRLFGISGLFGHIGLFSSGELGRYTAYAKDGDKLVSIKTETKTYVMSCDEPDLLLSQLG